MRKMRSLSDLARLDTSARNLLLRGAFEIESTDSAPMRISDEVWRAASDAMQVPRRAVERQPLIYTRDISLGTEAVFNVLRARRVVRRTPATPATSVTASASSDAAPCIWCHPARREDGQPDLAEDDFGVVRNADGRVHVCANWARSAPLSGVVFGDAHMHDLLALGAQELDGLIDGAERYIAAARQSMPQLDCFLVFINGGRKSAASVTHAHAQVVGRAGRHFGYAERIAAHTPRGYWQALQSVHADLGLSATFDGGTAWANLVPCKECCITGLSRNLRDGAAMMGRILETLIARGMSSYSLTAILAPDWDIGRLPLARFKEWPAVVWRLVDRGDAMAAHSDYGCMELFGSTVVATDPFVVAAWLRRAAAKGPQSVSTVNQEHAHAPDLSSD